MMILMMPVVRAAVITLPVLTENSLVFFFKSYEELHLLFRIRKLYPSCATLDDIRETLPLLCRLNYEVGQRNSFDLGGSRQSNGRSNPEVVGSIPTGDKRFFLCLVWFPVSHY